MTSAKVVGKASALCPAPRSFRRSAARWARREWTPSRWGERIIVTALAALVSFVDFKLTVTQTVRTAINPLHPFLFLSSVSIATVMPQCVGHGGRSGRGDVGSRGRGHGCAAQRVPRSDGRRGEERRRDRATHAHRIPCSTLCAVPLSLSPSLTPWQWQWQQQWGHEELPGVCMCVLVGVCVLVCVRINV